MIPLVFDKQRTRMIINMSIEKFFEIRYNYYSLDIKLCIHMHLILSNLSYINTTAFLRIWLGITAWNRVHTISIIGLREVSRTFAIRHSPFNGKWQKFDIRCVKLSCHSNSVVHFLKGEGSWWIFLGGQRYFVRNGSNSRWNASYVDGICQAASSDILERSCSSFGRGKVMISFLGRARPFCAYKKLFDMDCSLWSRNKSPFIAGHSQ